jgi:ubiquinone/menaquinone biosynthesis C-methylase UbiE
MTTDLSLQPEAADIEIQWSVYAEYYDAMCSVNPAYGSMIDLVVENFDNLHLPPNFKAIDIGAGTGNLLARIAPHYPDASFLHLDQDEGMNKWAKKKYLSAGEQNIRLVQADFLNWQEDRGKYEVVMSTNALYAMHPHEEALAKIYGLLKPGGHLLLVDFGRKQNTNDWLFYITRSSLKQNGISKTLRILKDNWEVARQNKRTTAAQEQGNYWLHETSEFKSALSRTGFEVLTVSSCYRGYSDIAVCKKL